MKTLKFTSLALLIIAVSLFTGTSISYSSSNDDNHLSANDSIYSPPGYMNKEIQQARSLTDKYLANKDKADNKTEATQREVSQKVQTQAVEKPKPQLKQKQSAKGKIDAQVATKIVDVTSGVQDITYKPDGVVVATEKNAQGKIIAETYLYNGVQTRHIYVSNDTSKYAINSIINGINAARNGKGDVVLIKEGTYNMLGTGFWYKNNIKIVGEDTKNTKINISHNSGEFGFWYSSNITIKNLTLQAGERNIYSGICISQGNNMTIENNIISGFKQGGLWLTSTNNLNLLNNEIKGNTYVAVWFANDSNVTFRSNIIHDNRSVIMKSSHPLIPTSFKDYSDNYTYNNINETWNPGQPELQGNYNYSPYKTLSNIKGNEPILLNLNKPLYPNTQLHPDSYSFSTIFMSNDKNISTITKALLLSKDMLARGMMDNAGPVTIEKIVKESLGQSALALPDGQADPQAMEMAMRLASILNNPTEAQKVTIDSIKALLNDINKVEEASANQSPELKKASDDLLQMVANILLAQAVPDLLNKGDVSNIKAMFSELDTQRNKIMLEYAQSTKPYYENMIKDLAKNMAMLQAKNLLNPNMSKDELSKLPPSELDKILDKIRNMKDKSFEEKYLLQQEAKYRRDYLDPNNKKLESDMKDMLKSFTGRINDVLKSSDKK